MPRTKTTSNFDDTMGRRKPMKVDKRKDSKGKIKAWWLQKWMKMMGQLF
jgi:hypothetical protein